MRIKWLAVAAILAPAEAYPSYESRQCETYANTAACTHIEGTDYFGFDVVGDTCYIFCMDSCNDEGSVPIEGTTLMTSCVPNAKIWGWYVIIFFILCSCWLVQKVLNCIFCCGKGAEMH